MHVCVCVIAMVSIVPPSVSVLPEDSILVLPSGSTLELVCNVTGVPPPTITWSHNGRSLESDGTDVVIMDDALFVLEVAMADSGSYHCSASSAAGMAASSRLVLVLVEAPVRETDVVLREDVVLPCGNQSLPPATPTFWFFDGSLLAVTSEDYVVLQNGSLLLRGVELMGEGNYTCEVGGQINFTTSVTILGNGAVLVGINWIYVHSRCCLFYGWLLCWFWLVF